MDLVAAGKYDQALQIILEKNPLPFTTGTVCYHTCMNSCTRNFCDAPVEIRRNKLIAAEKGYASVMTTLQAAPSNGRKRLSSAPVRPDCRRLISWPAAAWM